MLVRGTPRGALFSGGIVKNSSTMAALYAAALCTHICIGLLLPTIPDYARDLGVPESQLGLIANAFSLSMALSLIAFGFLSDKLGHRKMLVVALALFAPGTLLYPLASNSWQLGIVGAVRGLTCAAFIPAMAAVLIDLARPGERGKALGRFGFVTLLGTGIGPYLGGVITKGWGFDAVFYVCAVVATLGLVLMLIRLTSLPQKPAKEISKAGHSWEWLGDRHGLASLSVPFLLTVGSGLIYTYLGGYVKPFGIEEDGVGSLISIMYLSSAFSRAPAGAISDRVGRRPVILLGLFISIVSVVLIPSFQSFATLSIAALLYGIGMGIAMTPSTALLADVAHSNARGRAMGALNTSLHLGLFAGPGIIGSLLVTSGYSAVFRACALTLAVGLFLVFALLRGPIAKRNEP
jgi:DHA1 family multidrug resistance protein-like MFS transporter